MGSEGIRIRKNIILNLAELIDMAILHTDSGLAIAA